MLTGPAENLQDGRILWVVIAVDPDRSLDPELTADAPVKSKILRGMDCYIHDAIRDLGDSYLTGSVSAMEEGSCSFARGMLSSKDAGMPRSDDQ